MDKSAAPAAKEVILMDDPIGENPTLGGEMKVMVEFEAAIHCIHGYTIAPFCALCRQPNWLDCPVRPDAEGRKRTVRDVVKEFIDAGKIPSVRVVRRHVRIRQRQARAAARQAKLPKAAPKGQPYKRWSVIAGLAVVSGVLLYEGGKLVLKLFIEKRKDNPR